MKKRESALIIGVALFMLSLSSSAQASKKNKTGEEAEAAVSAQITDIQTPEGKRVVIQGTRKMQCAVFVIPDPIRMMINLTGVVPAAEIPRTLNVNQGLIKTIGVSKLSSGDKVVTRLELVLTQDAEYSIEKTGQIVTVTLEPKQDMAEADDTIPLELYSRAQQATTELIQTGEITPEIHTQVVVPASPPSHIMTAPVAGATVITSAEIEAMKEKVLYPGTATRVVDIEHRISEDQFQILIRTDGTVGGYEEFTVNRTRSRPNRLAIDLIEIKGPIPRSSYPVNQAGIKRIRLGHHPDKTRIVLDFSTKKIPQYYVMRTKSGIMVAVPVSSE